MNQQEIHNRLDKLLAKAESDIEIIFAKRLKEILFRISEIYRKYGKGGEPSWTDLNKYNRFQKEMEVISKMFSDDYRQLIKEVNKSMETQYVENFLMAAFLFQMASGEEMGFTIPSTAIVREAIANPVEFLTLPKIFKQHRDEIVRKINIEISQGLIAGESYADMAERIRKAVGFSQKKARLVARTEAGRVRSIADGKVADQASQYVKMGKVWMSSLDLRVRASHRKLDGQKADKDGYFHYKGMKAKGPHLWGKADMDINCRCVVMHTVNDMIPEYRRGRDYMDIDYQQKLADRIDSLMADEGLTYLQSLKKAQKEVQPPSVTIPYVTFEEWKKKLAS
ncbi:phage minor head protein [Metabacillus fastidiosus]|uniref:phage minor head protein n=1 Tax=Metabacillus fastidiosus TaxID=1458 RepID=UPI000826F120|nr:phage minor head protein [Metabacillus fastidiosus]MED4461853.1 phage minor head protein [Metabacillus fastidiosus]